MRTITVLVESTQKTVTFESQATTLGELKRELQERNIDYRDDAVFKESRSKSILAANDSVLPSNIPWKGDVTNDLVFMITAPQKRITSGEMSRSEAYDKIKELNLQDTIKKEEGRNFTQCSTATLLKYIAKASKSTSSKTSKATVKKNSEKVSVSNPIIAKEKPTTTKSSTETTNIEKAISLIEKMIKLGNITSKDGNNIIGVLSGDEPKPIEKQKSYDELASEFKGW